MSGILRRRASVVLGLFLCAAPLAGQNGPDAGPSPLSPPRPPLASTLRTGEIRIDGLIDEAAWELAPVATDFVQSEPDEWYPSLKKTEARVLVDDEAIYVAARMFEDPEKIGMLLMRRDERSPLFDWFGFSVDPNLDRRTGYSFRVSAAGVQEDYFVSGDQFEDFAWNAVWESGVTIDSLGWTAEFRIPLSQIRYAPVDGPRTWGVNFTRRVSHLGEQSHYGFITQRKEEGIASKYVPLENVVVPGSIRRIEARPYLLSSLHRGPAEEGNPFFDGTAGATRVGADFRIGLGSSFTVDATVNPDFGQVDADPREINLTAFETFFDERRPFFVEEAQTFDFRLGAGQNQLFYSRRIGRSPHGEAPDGVDFVDLPEAATIAGAAKVTGRTSRGLSMGLLTALTQAEKGEAFVLGSRESLTFDAEPRTHFGVLSAQQDLNAGASQIGAMVTALDRSLPSGGTLNFLADRAYAAGVRVEHQWSARTWRLNGFLAGSHVTGTPAALLAIQTASNHYFQRPDATRARLDPTATSLSGRAWRLQLDRQNTEHWTGSVALEEVSHGFEVNDLGFSGAREFIGTMARVGYREIRPGRIFRDYNLSLQTTADFSHEALDDESSWDSWRRAYVSGRLDAGAAVTFLNFHGASLDASWEPDRYSRDATRGGPIMLEPGSRSLRLGLNSDRRQGTRLNLGVNLARAGRDSGGQISVNASLGLRPSSQVTVDIQPRFSVQENAQYVGSTSVQPYAPTFGRRYLFGDLERKTLTLEARASYTLSPTLSFQLYAQGLISSGAYVAYKQLATPGSYDFQEFSEGRLQASGAATTCVGGSICRGPDGRQHLDFDGDGTPDYSFANRDFNVRSLLGNAVLRWEYRPGSAVFFVWQRQQLGNGSIGDFRFQRDLDALWGAPADNRFIVKANCWLGF